ncbi:DUF5590 domain-containing protein [Liquorilactobacillus cacaonum]|uniref:Cell wall elongation regulator TseB-like domain-containing protein n=1 Tax=Liquorilactobacillus cacaonum DSM 21116 TaxID=1423729 RepID=A0A0R2CGV6_9LACO|nr:DUF5590 domain-containing protein [Liquorilactobacillus cacaonum]KRM90897.1 hypothetical protein FC80_GL000891 [Liquorilactobacillus cacaonum DSM 21116]
MKRVKGYRSGVKKLFAIAFIVVVFFGVGIIYWQAQSPRETAEKNAISFARKHADLKSETAFYLFNRKQTYFTVAGTNTKNQKIFVIIAKKGGATKVLLQNKGISETGAIALAKKENPKKILKATLGLWSNNPVWEVTYLNNSGNLCYVLYNYKNGNMVKSIQNI